MIQVIAAVPTCHCEKRKVIPVIANVVLRNLSDIVKQSVRLPSAKIACLPAGRQASPHLSRNGDCTFAMTSLDIWNDNLL